MRTLGHALPRFSSQLVAGGFSEEGRGLGFSIGGWHPFRINTYLPTLKKLDPLANTSLGKAVWKPIEKINQSVNKDFAKAKVWSQDHRKQLQIAAALAATVVGGFYAYGAIAGEGAAGAAGAAGAGAAETTAAGGLTASTSSVFASEALVPLSTASTIVPASLLAPGVVSSAAAVAAPTIIGASAGTSILSTIGGVLGGIAKSVVPILALAKSIGGGAQQPQGAVVDTSGYYGGGYQQGGGGGGGGGGSLGPAFGGDQGAQPPTPGPLDGIPTWAWIVGTGAILYYISQE